MRELTEAQYRKQQNVLLKYCMADIKKELERKLQKAFKSNVIPKEWKGNDDARLVKAVITSWCKDMQYDLLNAEDKKTANNIHLFI